jgi:hypothetical protein
MKIEKLFEDNRGKSVLFLGRVQNLTVEEIQLFLDQFDMKYIEEADDNMALMIESSMMTPIEEDIAYDLYKGGLASFKLSEFEKFYALKIKPNSLLMSLKLSNNQERLKRVLKNESFEDDLFLKLFRLYDWCGEGVYDNDDNRDMSISFVKRFYRPDSFMDPAIIYSPVTLSTVISSSEDSQLLDVVLSMPNYGFLSTKNERKRAKNLRELVASNRYISIDSMKKLLSFRDGDIDYFLASNISLNDFMQDEIYQRADDDIKMMLSQNSSLSEKLFDTLLNESEIVVQNLLAFGIITEDRLEKILSKNLPNKLFSIVGENSSIEDIVSQLLSLDIEPLALRLSANSVVKGNFLDEIYKKFGDSVVLSLSTNPNISSALIEEFFEKSDYEIDKLLAANPASPKEILVKLFDREDREINKALASNESLELYYLQQLQLDSSLLNTLSKNRTFTENILNNLGI